jgi:hypothetical protein
MHHLKVRCSLRMLRKPSCLLEFLVVGQHEPDLYAVKTANISDGIKILGQQARKQKIGSRCGQPQHGRSQFSLASAIESTSVWKTLAVLESSDIL